MPAAPHEWAWSAFSNATMQGGFIGSRRFSVSLRKICPILTFQVLGRVAFTQQSASSISNFISSQYHFLHFRAASHMLYAGRYWLIISGSRFTSTGTRLQFVATHIVTTTFDGTPSYSRVVTIQMSCWRPISDKVPEVFGSISGRFMYAEVPWCYWTIPSIFVPLFTPLLLITGDHYFDFGLCPTISALHDVVGAAYMGFIAALWRPITGIYGMILGECWRVAAIMNARCHRRNTIANGDALLIIISLIDVIDAISCWSSRLYTPDGQPQKP
jgi:hypothetical protein